MVENYDKISNLMSSWRPQYKSSVHSSLVWERGVEEESPPRLYLLSFTPIGFLMGLVKYRWKRKRSVQPHTRCRKLERLRICRSCAWMLQSSMYPGYSLTLLGCAWSVLFVLLLISLNFSAQGDPYRKEPGKEPAVNWFSTSLQALRLRLIQHHS